MNKRSAQRHESSNPVKPIYTTSVEMPHEMEMQKEDEEDSRDDEDVKLLFCRKPPQGSTESEKGEQAESDEEPAKRTRLNIEQSLPLNALRTCSGRKRNDKRCSTYDVVELFSYPR